MIKELRFKDYEEMDDFLYRDDVFVLTPSTKFLLKEESMYNTLYNTKETDEETGVIKSLKDLHLMSFKYKDEFDEKEGHIYKLPNNEYAFVLYFKETGEISETEVYVTKLKKK